MGGVLRFDSVVPKQMSGVRSPAQSRLPCYQDLLDKKALAQGERVFSSQRKVTASPFAAMLVCTELRLALRVKGKERSVKAGFVTLQRDPPQRLVMLLTCVSSCRANGFMAT